ncbi:MAG: ABC transporter ATP-binding protein [Candidatus Methanomethylicia archaeon]
MEYTIETVDLLKTYVSGTVEYPALRNVNLKVARSEYVAIVGPSGSGKTTLLNLIGALDKPTKGEVYIDGIPISKLNHNQLAELRSRKIGFVFQTYNLIPYLNVLGNVELPMMSLNTPPKLRRKKALEILETLGLADKAYKKPNELSGGEQQRVAIARALVNDPAIVLADEPTGNLDSKTALNVVETFNRLNTEREVTVILVTHNLEITKFCHRIVYLRDGSIVREVIQRK